MPADSDDSPSIDDYKAKTRIVAAWLIEPNITGSEAAADALDCSDQYIRDITKILNEDGADAMDADTLETARSSALRNLISERLERHDVLSPDTKPLDAPKPITGTTIEQLEALHDELDLMRREAEWEEDKGKEFVANHGVSRLESILDDLRDE